MSGCRNNERAVMRCALVGPGEGETDGLGEWT